MLLSKGNTNAPSLENADKKSRPAACPCNIYKLLLHINDGAAILASHADVYCRYCPPIGKSPVLELEKLDDVGGPSSGSRPALCPTYFKIL